MVIDRLIQGDRVHDGVQREDDLLPLDLQDLGDLLDGVALIVVEMHHRLVGLRHGQHLLPDLLLFLVLHDDLPLEG